MALTTPHTTAQATEADQHTGSAAGTSEGRAARRRRDADGMTVASFVLGLVGLLVGNIFLGPAAVVLAVLALSRGTARTGRALLGLALGLSDLAVLAAFTVADGTMSWGLAG